ncbi:MAG: hypothetical protein C0608_10295 [Deltaproteobacteria bacterium]|nr:MAG: hypothetical protein C0608_10295 [Deltaproteobacteria bacterium]
MKHDITPHNFLLSLRGVRPDIARLFDGVRSLGFFQGRLSAKVDIAAWPGSELVIRAEEVEGLVKAFFGEESLFELDPADPDRERLPFPLLSSKVWNHIAFLCLSEEHVSAFIIRKPSYERLRRGDEASLEEAVNISLNGALALPELVDELTALAREDRSYVHLLAPFPGHGEAELWEALLYRVKEWGTPSTPAPVIQKYLGRLHWSDPDSPPLGIIRARRG